MRPRLLRAGGAAAAAGRRARGPLNARAPTLRLVGKPDCHLCHEMRAVVERVLARTGGTLIEIDVRDDPELERRYLLEIPVLLLGEIELARHRISEAELRAALEARS